MLKFLSSIVFGVSLISAGIRAQEEKTKQPPLLKGGEVSGGGTLVTGGGLKCPVLVDLLVYNPDFSEPCPTHSISNPVPAEQQGVFFDKLLEAAESSADRKAVESLRPGFDRFPLDALPEKWLLQQEIREWKALLPNLESQFESMELALNSKTIMWFLKPGRLSGVVDHHIPENLKSAFDIYQFERAATTFQVYTVFGWAALQRLGAVSRKAIVLHELGRIAFPGIQTSGLQKLVGALILEPRNSRGALAVAEISSQKDVNFDSSGEYFERIEKTFLVFLSEWNSTLPNFKSFEDKTQSKILEVETYFHSFSKLPRSLSSGIHFCQNFVSHPNLDFLDLKKNDETSEGLKFYKAYQTFWWKVLNLSDDGITLSVGSKLNQLASATAQIGNAFGSIIFDQIIESTQDYPFNSFDIENHLLNESEGIFGVSKFQLKKSNYSGESFRANFSRMGTEQKFTLDGGGFYPLEGEWVADSGYVYIHMRHRGEQTYLAKLKISQSASALVFGSDIDLVGEIFDMSGQTVGTVHLDD